MNNNMSKKFIVFCFDNEKLIKIGIDNKFNEEIVNKTNKLIMNGYKYFSYKNIYSVLSVYKKNKDEKLILIVFDINKLIDEIEANNEIVFDNMMTDEKIKFDNKTILKEIKNYFYEFKL
jgi:ribosomal protein S7